MADRDPRKDPREGDEFEAPPRPYYLQEQRTIIERYEKDGKAMVRYETTDGWGGTIHHKLQPYTSWLRAWRTGAFPLLRYGVTLPPSTAARFAEE